MTATPLPPLPEIDDAQCIPYQSVRYVAGFTKDFVKQYAQAYATQARADLEAENADLKRKLAEASNTLCMGGQMISAIANALKDTK